MAEVVYRIVNARSGKPIYGARKFLSRRSLAGHLAEKWNGQNILQREPGVYRIECATVSEWEDVTDAFVPDNEQPRV